MEPLILEPRTPMVRSTHPSGGYTFWIRPRPGFQSKSVKPNVHPSTTASRKKAFGSRLCIFIYIYIYIYMYMCIYMCVYIYIHVYIYVCVYICICVCV